jgi:hypothetical protein
MYHNPKVPSLSWRVGISGVLGLTIASLGALIEMAISGRAFSLVEAIDDIIIGILAALVVFGYEQRRYRQTLERIRVIAGMNHHVRNALQAISYAPYTEQATQIKLVEQSVSRIEWALREILPGEAESGETEPTPPADTNNYSTAALKEQPSDVKDPTG